MARALTWTLIIALTAGGAYLWWPERAAGADSGAEAKRTGPERLSAPARELQVGSANPLPTVEFGSRPETELAPGQVAKLTGRVLGPDQKPVAQAQVRVVPVDEENNATDSVIQGIATKEGRFVFADLKPGRWMVEAFDSHHALAEPLAFQVPEVGLTNLELELSAGATLKIRPQDLEGRPLPGAAIALTFSEGTALPISTYLAKADQAGLVTIVGPRIGSHWSVDLRLETHFRTESSALEATAAPLEKIVICAPKRTVAGTVVDLDGTPQPQRIVSLQGQRITTDDAGRFRYTNLTIPPSTVVVFAADQDLRRFGRLGVVLEGPPVLEDVAIVIRPQSRITGRVVDREQRPVEGVTVEARPAKRRSSERIPRINIVGQSDQAHGSELFISGLQSNQFRVRTSWTFGETTVAKTSGASALANEVPITDHVEEAVAYSLTSLVSGEVRVKDLDVELAQGQVVFDDLSRVLNYTGEKLALTHNYHRRLVGFEPTTTDIENSTRSAVTDADGRFEILGVLPGSYRITPSKSEYFFLDPSPIVTLQVEGEEQSADLVLARGAVIELSLPPLPASPPSEAIGVTVKLRDSNGNVQEHGLNAEDLVSVGGLTAGTYQISVERTGGELAYLGPLTLDYGQRERIPVQFHAASSIQAKVLGPDGAALPAATVRIRGRGSEFIDGPPSTNEEGQVTFVNLPGGKYELLASADGLPERSSGEFWVSAGTEERITIPLKKGGSVRGKVVDPRGHPLPGMSVFLRTPADRLDATSDENGEFSIHGLPDGVHPLHVRSEDMEQSAATEVTIEQGSDVVASVTLRPSLVIHGRLLRKDGRPAGGVEMSARGTGPTDIRRTATTRADGTFSLGKLYPGSYTLRANGVSHPAVPFSVQYGEAPPTLEVVEQP